jgi:membrane peptidoglycan carboxypeptidase
MIKNFFVIVFWAFLAFGSLTAYLYVTAPVDDLRGIVTYTPPFKNYTLRAGLGMPDNLTFENIPADLILLTMIGEDPAFPYHHGVNLAKIYDGIVAHFADGDPLVGNSGITQQIVKNVSTGPGRNLYRKYVELIYAIKLERHFSKSEIFTIYANLVQVGPDSYGFKAAAQEYFGTSLRQLHDIEYDFIVSNLPAPSVFPKWYIEKKDDPTRHNFERMAWKMQYLLLLKDKLFVPGEHPIVDADFFQHYFHGVTIEVWEKSKPHEQYKAESERAAYIFIHNHLK